MKCPACNETNLAITERPGSARSRADDRDRYERHSRDDGYRHQRHESLLRDRFD